MIAKATARYIRISPRKTRLIADYIRGKSVGEALSILSNLNKSGRVYMEELLRSAIANAKRNPEITDEGLYISKLIVDGGPMLKRFRAASMGRATMVRHRLSHITVELDTMQSLRGQVPSSKKSLQRRENLSPPPVKKKRVLLKRRSAK